MGTIIGNIAPGASPSQEDFRVFETQSALNTYLSSARAKAGQTVKLKDTTTGKYKAYIIQGTAGNFTTTAMSGSFVYASALPSVANADADTDYYIGEAVSGDNSVIAAALPDVSEGDATKEYYIGTAGTGYLHYRFVDGAFVLANGYTHYRLINGVFVAVGGDSYNKDEVDALLEQYGVQLTLDGNQLKLVNSDGDALGNTITIPQQGLQGLDVDVVAVEGLDGTEQWLVVSDSESNELDRVKLPAGGGVADNNSVRLYNRTGGSTNFTTASGSTTNIVFSFHESDPEGHQTSEKGHIKIYYKDSTDPDSAYVQFASMDINQDTDTTVNVTDYLTVGGTTNIKVTATGSHTESQDAQGNVVDTTVTKSLIYTVACIEISIESRNANFPNDSLSTAVFSGDTNITYRTYGLGLAKTMHIEIDGETLETYNIGTSHAQTLSRTLPVSEWNYGAHNLCYYFVTESGAVSNKLHNIVMYNDGSSSQPIVGLDKSVTSVVFGENIPVKYVVVTPGAEVTASVRVDLLNSSNETIRSITQTNVSPNSQQTLAFDSEVYGSAGNYKIRVISGTTMVTHNISVSEYVSPYEIAPVDAGLVYYFNAAGHTNVDNDKEEYSYTYNGNSIYANNTGFNWATNGYIQTTLKDRFKANVTHSATALRLSGSATHTIQLPIFTTHFTNKDGDDVRIDTNTSATVTTNGRTIEFDYNVVAASNDDTTIISCATTTDDEHEKYVGFKVTPLTCGLKSTNLQAGTIRGGFITEEEACAAAYLQKNTDTSGEAGKNTEHRVHLSFVVEGLNTQGDGKQTINIYVNGQYAKSLPYGSRDSFGTNSVITIGSPEAIVDLYNVRVYNRSLSSDEVLQNFCASQATISERESVAEFNDVLDDNLKVDYTKARQRYMCLLLKGDLAPDKSHKRYAGVTLTMADATAENGYVTLLNLNDTNPNHTPSVDPDSEDYVGKYYCSNKVQGTSSQRFIRKNYKVYLVNGSGQKVKYSLKGYSDGTFVYDSSKSNLALSIPESTLCYKMDYMSSDHANTYNANMANGMFGDTTVSQDPTQGGDARVQNTVYGVRCLLFHQPSGTDEIVFAGDGMLNNDKGNTKTFGLEVSGDSGNNTTRQKWEFLNNTEDICNFKTDKLQEIKTTTQEGEGGEQEEVSYVAVTAALESTYPDQGDLEDDGLLPNYDHIQVLYTWLCQRANYWDADGTTQGTFIYNDTVYLTEREYRKAIFKNEFAQHFNMNHALTYYCFIDYTALVDNRAKNMFLRCENVRTEDIVFTGEETSIADIISADGTVDADAIDWENSTFAQWITDLYDLDSCFGAENSGYLRIPYYAAWNYMIDQNTHGFNGYESRLWLMFEDSFGAEIKSKWQALALSGLLTYNNFRNTQITNGNALMSAAIVNRDMEYKYNDAWTEGYVNQAGRFIYTDEYKYMQRGDREPQKDTFLYKRAQLKYSQYQTKQFFDDYLAFRPRVTSAEPLPITLSSMQYIYPAVGLDVNHSRIAYPDNNTLLLAPNTNITISTAVGATDNLLVYSASNISTLDISQFKPYEINISNAGNLKQLILGSEASGHTFTPSAPSEWNFSSCPLLEVLNLGGAQSVSGLNISQNIALEELYAANSTFTNVTFPNGGSLETVHLPDSLITLEIHNNTSLSSFSCQGYDNLQTLIVENTPIIPISDLLINHLEHITALRLTNVTIELGDDENDIIGLLLSDDVKGRYVDEMGRSGDENARPFISGTLTVNSIGHNKAEALRAAYPYLTVSSANEYTQYQVDFVVDNQTVVSYEVDQYNSFTTSFNSDGLRDTFPYKESSSDGNTHYLFKQWNITATDGSATEATVNESTVSQVDKNLTVTAEFITCTLPVSPKSIPQDGYLYWNTYNDDPTKSAYTTGEFYAICMSDAITMINGGYYALNQQIRIDVDETYKSFFSGWSYLLFDIVGVQHYELAAYPGRFANVLFCCHNVVASYQMNTDNINAGGWDASKMRHWLNGNENTNGCYQRTTNSGAKLEQYYYTISGTNQYGQTGTIVNTSSSLVNYSQSLWGKLPYQFRVMISAVNVLASSGNATKSTEDMITSVDKLFLFSIFEAFNDSSFDVYKAEVNRNGLNGDTNPATRKYYLDYFVSNGGTLGFRKKDYNGATSGQWWWLRTPEPSNGTGFRGVNNNGGSDYNNARYSSGVAFGFNIGIPKS